MPQFKRPQYLDVDNPVSVTKGTHPEISQSPKPGIGITYPIGKAGPNGQFAAQPYRSEALGVRGGNPTPVAVGANAPNRLKERQ